MEEDEDPGVHDPTMAMMGEEHQHSTTTTTMMPPHHLEFLDCQPSKEEIFEMKRATKRPSEWLKLLCKDWAEENLQLVESTDHKFIEYKPYLKGFLSSQLLCRLCVPNGNVGVVKHKDDAGSPSHQNPSNDPPFDFWKMLSIEDEFDKAYIIAQVERFCTLYNIRGNLDISSALDVQGAAGPANSPEAAAAAAAAAVAAASGQYLSPDATAAAVAAAQLANKAAAHGSTSPTNAVRHVQTAVSTDAFAKAQRLAREAERQLEHERKLSVKREQKRQTQERKLEKQRERDRVEMKKRAEKVARDQTREEKRKKKVEMREQREKFAMEQKEAALKRAAELVASNRVPIEITRGAAAAKEAADKALKQIGGTADEDDCVPITAIVPLQGHQESVATLEVPPIPGPKKQRSAIVVSTASDLHRIVTHSKNLWAKYNAIAKEHNQKVNWITVAKELGIHVKVREKYARMHSRAEQRGFDWKVYGHWKIKDHPEIFVEPTQAEQKARMPPPPPDASTTVLIPDLDPARASEQARHHDHSLDINRDGHGAAMGTDEAVVAAAAAVVDATGVGTHMATSTTMDSSGTNAALSATYVSDPTKDGEDGGHAPNHRHVNSVNNSGVHVV